MMQSYNLGFAKPQMLPKDLAAIFISPKIPSYQFALRFEEELGVAVTSALPPESVQLVKPIKPPRKRMEHNS